MIAEGFKQKSTCDVIGDCVGAVDGYLIRISCPKAPVENPIRYMCRKHFFALNIQAVAGALFISLPRHCSNPGAFFICTSTPPSHPTTTTTTTTARARRCRWPLPVREHSHARVVR